MNKFGILVFAGVLSLSSNAFAQTGGSMSTKPTIVFVHGLWADGSPWSKVINPLVDKGYKVISVQNPTTSLADDVLHAALTPTSPNTLSAFRGKADIAYWPKLHGRHAIHL